MVSEPLESRPSPFALTVRVPPVMVSCSPVSSIEPPPSAMPPGPICWVVVVVVVVVSELDSAAAARPASTVIEPEALMPSSPEVRSTVPSEIVMSPPSRASFDCVTVTVAPSRTAATSVCTPSSPEAAVIVPELKRRAPLEWMASSPASMVVVPPSTMM